MMGDISETKSFTLFSGVSKKTQYNQIFFFKVTKLQMVKNTDPIS